MVQKVSQIWFEGQLIPWKDAQISVLTHTLHYGLGVFEGIRAYQREDGRTHIFRLSDHIKRFMDGTKVVTIPMHFSQNEIEKACVLTLKANGLQSGYIRPIVYLGDGEMGLHAMSNASHTAIIVWPWGAYLGKEGLELGIRARISSFTRHQVNSSMVKAKINGQYVNSILAKREALADGYQEAFLLDHQGYVCEASGENIFLVQNGTLLTPPEGTSILNGITRQTVITLAKELGITVKEIQISRDMVYMADELFLTGTAAEITPVREVDHRTIGTGRPGPLTQTLQKKFFDIVKGSDNSHMEWLHFIDEGL